MPKQIEGVVYRDWRCMVEAVGANQHSYGTEYLYWEWEDTCVVTGARKTWRSRRWVLETYLPEHYVRTAFAALKMALEHEAGEFFMFHGERVFDPHKEVL